MPYMLSKRSLSKLDGVHPDLVQVVTRAIELSEVDFCVTEGLRSVDRQKKLVAEGKSQTMRSRHLTGHAVDLAAMQAGVVKWDMPLYHKIDDAMQKAAEEYDIPIVWGGNWKTLVDGPHWELDRKRYP